MMDTNKKPSWACQLMYLMLLSHSAAAQPSAVKVLLDWKASAAACSPTEELLPSWNETTPMSEWEGVTLMSEHGVTVTALDVSDSGLCGSLPPSLTQLSALISFKASVNAFTGSLPASYSSLTRLTNMLLGENKLQGPIPAGWSRLELLQELYLSSNRLSGPLPEWVSQLTHLTALRLAYNQFTSTVPAGWSRLQGLQQLTLGGNNLTGGPLPPVIGVLTQLTFLALENNQFTSSVPVAWSRLQELQGLALSDNTLIGNLPPFISAFTKLTWLELNANQFTSTVPAAWSTLQALQVLYLDDNRLVGNLPPFVSTLTSLTELALPYNQFTSTIPLGWSRLRALQYLYVDANQLIGSLPPFFSTLTKLVTLSLTANQFTSTIPTTWSMLQALTQLNLDKNKLVGSLPPFLGTLTSLVSLSLSANKFTSTIPTAWNKLQALQGLYLDNNTLVGSPPPFIGSLTALTELALSYNQFTSTIPSAWNGLQALQYLYIDANRLTGSFLMWVTALNKTLEVLSLANNQFNGTVPKNFFLNSNLSSVDISVNAFTGPVPILSDKLYYINASSNMFTGSLPSIPSGTDLVCLNLANNLLTATIPAINASNLAYLNLANNSFQALPPSLDTPNLRFLDVANNKLGGSLPEWTNHSMTYCDLSNNSLKGPVTQHWSNHDWSYLALDHNQLSDQLPQVWNGTVSVLLLQYNNFTRCIPGTWLNGGNSTAIIALSNNHLTGCGSGLPDFKGMLRNLTLLDLDMSGITSRIPLSWVDGSAFGNKTVLNLGRMWAASAGQDHRSWRKSVCITKAINSRLQQQLDAQLVDDLKAGVKNKVSTGLADLVQFLSEHQVVDLDYEVLLDISFHLPNHFSQPHLNDICGNQHARLIVAVQWTLVAIIISLLLVAYYLEVRFHFTATKVSQNPEHGCIFCSSIKLRFLKRLVERLVKIGMHLKFLVFLAFYWFDVALDIKVIVQVWQRGRWPGYVLLGICLCHYVTATGWLAWRWSAKVAHHWWPLAATPLLVPIMPLIDTVVALLLAVPEQHLPSWLRPQLDDWEQLFHLRDVMEVLLEAIPTAVVQSVVFVMGNTPDLGLYLDTTLYLLSALGSCVQLLRLVVVLLVRAVRKDVSPVHALKDLLLNKFEAVQHLPGSSKSAAAWNEAKGVI